MENLSDLYDLLLAFFFSFGAAPKKDLMELDMGKAASAPAGQAPAAHAAAAPPAPKVGKSGEVGKLV